MEKERYYKICDAIITAFRKLGSDTLIVIRIDQYGLDVHCPIKVDGNIETNTSFEIWNKEGTILRIPFLNGEHIMKSCTEAEWLGELKKYLPIEVTDDER